MNNVNPNVSCNTDNKIDDNAKRWNARQSLRIWSTQTTKKCPLYISLGKCLRTLFKVRTSELIPNSKFEQRQLSFSSFEPQFKYPKWQF